MTFGPLCPACGEAYGHSGAFDPACPSCGADLLPVQCCGDLHEAHLARADAALRGGLFRAALDHLEDAAVVAPLDWRGRLLRGLALVGAGRPSAARPYLDDDGAERLLPPALLAAEARYGAARALAAAGDLGGALSTLAQGPATGDGLVLYALCALRLGDRAAAEAALRAALESDPSNSHAAALLRL